MFLEGLQAYGYCGVSEQERAVGHLLQADLQMEVEGAATASDRVEDTVSYSEAAELVVSLIESSRHATLERMAGVLCEAVLSRFPSVQTVSLTLSKLNPPMPFSVESAGVELTRER